MSARGSTGGPLANRDPNPARRYAASPLLVDPDVPKGIVDEVVEKMAAPGTELVAVLVELNLRADADVDVVRQTFLDEVLAQVVGPPGRNRPDPVPISASFVRCLVTRAEIPRILGVDEARTERGTGSAPTEPSSPSRRTIFRIWPDYVMRPLIDGSVSTVKADAAGRTYSADGMDVVWAVLDTGIDAGHPHFSDGTLTDPAVAAMHADFTWIVRNEVPPAQPDPRAALTDENGHGTHVAGIIAGSLPGGHRPVLATLQPSTGEPGELDLPRWGTRVLASGRTLAGMAPKARLVSLKVLAGPTGEARTTSSAVIAALEHVRRQNAWGRLLRIHGVNLSLGCSWYYRDYAAGQSPVCRELDLLVGTGVVAVVSAGNGGFTSAASGSAGDVSGALSTITDPGNANRAITVGSTHRDQPHRFGVTYLSSKGPTLDGRLKPDLLAPGDRITSCASGGFLDIPVFAESGAEPEPTACYVEDSGTSMAAPHVSGVIAAFLSVRREYIGLPADVKELFTQSAISLGRDRFFEGHGLVDLMGALSKV